MKRLLLFFLLLQVFILSYGAPKKLVRGVSPSELQPFTETVATHLCSRAHTIRPLKVVAVYYYKNHTVEIYFSEVLSEQPIRRSDVEWLYATARKMLSQIFPKCSFTIFTDKKPVETLVSKWYSGEKYSDGIWTSSEGKKAVEGYAKAYAAVGAKASTYAFVNSSKTHLDTVKVSYRGHSSGMNGSSTADGDSRQWVSRTEKEWTDISEGLEGKNIALWNSHGRYYNNTKDKWTWQRPHLFQTCEEMLTGDIVLNYLAPMLENAGAYVIIPKERDINTDEVIVDEKSGGYSENGNWTAAPYAGFGRAAQSVGKGENPFTTGGARQIEVSSASCNARVCWKPELPKAGEYAVYVSYQSLPESTTAAYTVHHCGETSVFHVNQRMGGGTWVYLGTFFFDTSDDGGDVLRNGVTLTAEAVSDAIRNGKKVITADAVKFGGGYGSITRNGKRSGVPRFMEGSRYWLQYAGYPENMYSPFENVNDYKDDYTSRAIWVNSLSGGSEVNPYMSGYGVPVDLSLAVHTDAGTAVTDSIIGTLAIHATRSNGRNFLADGRSRYINRELCDIIQSSVVEDLRSLVDSSWSRRGIWDKSYFECREPEVPSMILELLSHQNFADMRLALDPMVRFTVARAIYKGILTFFKATKGDDFVVQPLPVRQFSAVNEQGYAKLRWSPTEDALEDSACPEGYVIYRRTVDLSEASDNMLHCPDRHYGFVREAFVTDAEYVSPEPLETGKIYSYKVVAVNKGGAAFPSEVLSVCVGEQGNALAVNCFDRISAPEFYGVTDSLEGGFMPWADRGVGYKRDITYAGDQMCFDKGDSYVDDDNPGFGASWNDFDTLVACGNTFDYTLMHAAVLSRAGYGFSSCSRDALECVSPGDYQVLDVIGGKQKSGGRYQAVLGRDVMDAVTETILRHGTVIMSGSYLLSDQAVKDDAEINNFIENVLKINYLSTLSPSGVESVSAERTFSELNTMPNSEFYSLERCDAVDGFGKDEVLLRYSNHGPSACQMYKGYDYKVIVAGFPLEAMGYNHLYMTLKSAL